MVGLLCVHGCRAAWIVLFAGSSALLCSAGICAGIAVSQELTSLRRLAACHNAPAPPVRS